ncbi:hypothetical protein HDU96_002872 [Phlyctochytrium bullatum]|nr:hypothetical protein HDU96_002872 [Phlyctochytrium bullatum]
MFSLVSGVGSLLPSITAASSAISVISSTAPSSVDGDEASTTSESNSVVSSKQQLNGNEDDDGFGSRFDGKINSSSAGESARKNNDDLTPRSPRRQQTAYAMSSTTSTYGGASLGSYGGYSLSGAISSSMSPSVFLKTSAFGERARRLVQLVNSMRDAGAHMDIDLPTVVVCGNQSVGKSSLIEALCGVVLPRAEGTCTRCVTEVRMTETVVGLAETSPKASSGVTVGSFSPEWNCSVKLRYEYDASGTALKGPREVIFIEDIKNPDDVELAVRRAQKAVLNPSSEPSKFVGYAFDDRTAAARDKEAASNEVKFTKNVVCVDIRGAGVNLTLIDLPGIIRSVDRKEDASFIDLIQDLVRKYISNERAIIVGTITCKDEIDNQAIVHMAKEVDPMGIRTMGVLTKPDTIETGTHDRWLQILLGHSYTLKLGYWMIKNPNKADLDRKISFEEARTKEESFFASHAPWSNLRHQIDRFGVDSLRRSMSRQLALLTDSSLPDMKRRTEDAMQSVALELSKMPPPLGENPRIELLQMIRHFSTVLGYNLSAHQDFKGFYQRIRAHFETFRRALYSSRPVFALDRKHSSLSAGAPQPSSSLTSSVSSAISSVWNTISSDDKKRDSGKSPAVSSSTVGTKPSTAPHEDVQSIELNRPLTLSDVRRIIDSQKGRELQGYSPYGAFTFIVGGFQEEWNKYAVACLANVSHELHTVIQKLTDDVFQTEIYRTTLEIVNNLVLMEKRYPFTMGSEEFSRLKSSALHEFKAQLEMVRNSSSLPSAGPGPTAAVIHSQRQETVNKALAALAEAGYTGLTAKDLARLRDNPEDDEVLHVMAASDAYFRLAFKRLGDNVPMHVDFHFLSRVGEGLEKELVARLGVLEKDAASVAAMVEEDRFVAERRKALQEQRVRLENEINERARAADAQIWHLNPTDFDKRVSANTWLIFYGVRWCKFCKRLSPRWLHVQNKFLEDGLLSKAFNLAKVDCTEAEDWCAAKNAEAYPSLYLYHKGAFVEEYMGDHEPEPIYEYINSKIAYYSSLAPEPKPVPVDPPKPSETKAEAITTVKGEPLIITEDGGITKTSGPAGKPTPGQPRTHPDL